jgi:hypothetical protein
VVWYQAYRKRFFSLPADVQALSPGKTAAEFNFNEAPDPSSLGQQLFGTQSFGQASIQTTTSDDGTAYHDDPLRSQPYSPLTPDTGGVTRPLVRASQPARNPCGATSSDLCAQQPFRDECERIVATFFAPNTRKELSLDSDIRDTVLRRLLKNTHPDVFLPAYEAVFYQLQTNSLPRFLTAASAVTCRPNQLGYVIWGSSWTVITLILFAATVACSPWDDFRSRAYRLVTVLPACIGVSFVYAAYRGYCLNISGRRGRMQLRSWELEAAGAATTEWWGSFTAPHVVASEYKDEVERKTEDVENSDTEDRNADSGSMVETLKDGAVLPTRLAKLAARQARKRREAMLVDVSIIAPFASDTIVHDAPASTRHRSNAGRRPSPQPVRISFTRRTVTSEDRSIHSIIDHKDPDGFYNTDIDVGPNVGSVPSDRRSRRSDSSALQPRHSSLPAPPVYGPEKVVLDPRVMALHRRELYMILAVIAATFVVSPHSPKFLIKLLIIILRSRLLFAWSFQSSANTLMPDVALECLLLLRFACSSLALSCCVFFTVPRPLILLPHPHAIMVAQNLSMQNTHVALLITSQLAILCQNFICKTYVAAELDRGVRSTQSTRVPLL